MIFKKLFSKKSPENEFWDWFIKKEPQLFYGTDSESQRDKIFQGLTNRLKSIDENLVYAFSPIKEDETKEFIISADGLKESFPIVLKLITAAPKLPNWNFIAFRQPNSGDDLSLKMGDIELGYNDIYFRYLEEEDKKLHLQLNIRNYDNSGILQHAAYILLDSLLGEYDSVTEIDYIDWEVLDEGNIENFYPFIELKKIIAERKVRKSES